MKFDGFIGPAYLLRNFAYDKQRTVNWFPEVDETGKGKDAEVAQFVPRPGLRKVLTGLDTPRGLYEPANNTLYGVFGSKLYSFITTSADPTQWTATEIIDGIPGTDRVQFTDNGFTLFLVAHRTAYAYTWDTGLFEQLSGGAYTAAFSPTYLNSRVIFNEPGSQRFFWTDQLSTTANALNFASAESDPEVATAVVSYNQELWIFGRRTIEIWYDATTGSPTSNVIFARRGNTVINSGCVAPYTIMKVAGTLAWLSQDNQGGPMAVLANGYNPMRISTFALEQEWSRYTPSQLASATAFSMQLEGHNLYCLNIDGTNTTWVYDATVSNQLGKPSWHEWQSDPGTGVQGRFLGEDHTYHRGFHVITAQENGDVFVFDPDYYFDDGQRIMRERTGPYISNEMKRVFYKSLTLNFNTGDRLPITLPPPPTDVTPTLPPTVSSEPQPPVATQAILQYIVEATIGTGEVKWYVFTLAAQAPRISIDLAGSTFDTGVALFNSRGDLITWNDDYMGSQQSHILFNELNADTYYVAVYGPSAALFLDDDWTVQNTGPGGFMRLNIEALQLPYTFGPERVFETHFDNGALNVDHFRTSSWTAPGSDFNVAQFHHIGFWSYQNLDLSSGALALKLDQTTTTDRGSWNAYANLPKLKSGRGAWGDIYTVSVAGNTLLDDTAGWQVGNHALFDGTVWRKVATKPTVISSGAEITTKFRLGYGTYELTVRAAGTAPKVDGTRQPVSGGITGVFSYFDGRADPVNQSTGPENRHIIEPVIQLTTGPGDAYVLASPTPTWDNVIGQQWDIAFNAVGLSNPTLKIGTGPVLPLKQQVMNVIPSGQYIPDPPVLVNLARNSDFEVKGTDYPLRPFQWWFFLIDAGPQIDKQWLDVAGKDGGKALAIKWLGDSVGYPTGFRTAPWESDTPGQNSPETRTGLRGMYSLNQWYSAGWWAKKVNGAGWTGGLALGWQTEPADQVVVSNPNLSTSFQWYEFQWRWTGSQVPEPVGNFYVYCLGDTATNDEIHADKITVKPGQVSVAYVADPVQTPPNVWTPTLGAPSIRYNANAGNYTMARVVYDGTYLVMKDTIYSELDFEVEGTSDPIPGTTGDPRERSNEYQVTSWTDDDYENNESTMVDFADPESAYADLKYVWDAESVKFYINGVLKRTNTSRVPTTAAHFIINHWGTNNYNFGGWATPFTPRYMWVSHFKYTSSNTNLARNSMFAFKVEDNRPMYYARYLYDDALPYTWLDAPGWAALRVNADVASGPFGIRTASWDDEKNQLGVYGGWAPNTDYCVSFEAMSPTTAWTGMALGWDNAQAIETTLINPVVSTTPQAYVFYFKTGATPQAAGNLFIRVVGATASGNELHLRRLHVETGTVPTKYVEPALGDHL